MGNTISADLLVWGLLAGMLIIILAGIIYLVNTAPTGVEDDNGYHDIEEEDDDN